jgi:hypothetical protein
VTYWKEFKICQPLNTDLHYVTYAEPVTGVPTDCCTTELACSSPSLSCRYTIHAKFPRIFQLSTFSLFPFSLFFPVLYTYTSISISSFILLCSLLSIYEAIDERKREKCLRSVWYLKVKKKKKKFLASHFHLFPKLSFSVCTGFSPSHFILALTLEFTRDKNKKKYNRKGIIDALGHRSNLFEALCYIAYTGGWKLYSEPFNTVFGCLSQ